MYINEYTSEMISSRGDGAGMGLISESQIVVTRALTEPVERVHTGEDRRAIKWAWRRLYGPRLPLAGQSKVKNARGGATAFQPEADIL